MGCDKLKNLLAGIGLAGLMAGVAMVSPGSIHGASGWGGSSGAGGAEEKAKSGWGGSTGAGGTLKDQMVVPPAPVQKTMSSVKQGPVKKKLIKKNIPPPPTAK